MIKISFVQGATLQNAVPGDKLYNGDQLNLEPCLSPLPFLPVYPVGEEIILLTEEGQVQS
jgi:hypothetical protein